MNPTPHPPRWLDKLLEWLCAPELREEVLGDLHERYYRRAERLGEAEARRYYWREVFSYIRFSNRKQKSILFTTPFSSAMLRNYLTSAWRNVVKNKAFSTINILGLALGMAASLLLFYWVRDELRIDAYHANGPHLYHVIQNQFYDGKVETGRFTPGILPDELKTQFPEIVYAAGYSWEVWMTFSVDDKVNKEMGHWAGTDWFKMFSIPLLAGTPETALNSPTSLAISRKVAEAYFGDPSEALGKSIRINNQNSYQVTAVFENLPANSSDRYDFLLSWEDFVNRNAWMKDWDTNGPHTRVQLRPDADVASVNARLKTFLRKYNRNLGDRFDAQLFLQPYMDGYLHSNFENGKPNGGRIEYVHLFSMVAVFLILIASINFMNLATARSAKRAKEVGIRKVVGAGRQLLVGQFLGEAWLLIGLALLIALMLVSLMLPAFNALTGKSITLYAGQPSFWLILVGTTLLTGLLAGSYPAVFLSSLNPVRALKGELKFSATARLFRQGLVVFQFVLSMLLIVGTIVIYRQMNYVQTKNLGYDRENLLYLPLEGELSTKFETLKQELLRQPGIQSVTYMQDLPTDIDNGTGGIDWPGKDPQVMIQFTHTSVGYDFIKTLKINLTGRDFSSTYGTDSVSYIINQAALKRIGYKDPIGQPITMWGKPGKIIGVMEDFHFQSLHAPIKPIIVRFSSDPSRKRLMVRTHPGQTQQAIASLEAICKQFNPAFPFNYNFVNEEYEDLYQSETVVGSLAKYFALLAIFISCLGLFGLAAFTAEQRVKEIGVRKVLGASFTQIVGLLSRDFLRLVLLAIVIASPIAWYVMRRWLENFAYSLDLEWWIFALAGAMAIFIALLTVSYQATKAALMNPVKSLRNE